MSAQDTTTYTKRFDQLHKEDVGIAGGKGANLGELTQSGIPVPEGFVVLSSAYFAFLDANKLRPHIHKILSACDINNAAQLNEASQKIQSLILKSEFPKDIAQEIFNHYDQLGAKAVAVRSSATAEDLPEASFAGQQESFLNITGDANVLIKVRECYASLFGARSIFYRQEKHFDHFKVGIAVPVQKMVQSDTSGVMFTVDPISRNKDVLVIEAVYGLGDYIVQGVVTPDHYEVSKADNTILTKNIGAQHVMEVRSKTGVSEKKVESTKSKLQKISDAHILEIAALGKKIHQHYFFPQDIEWAIEKGKVYITQARPITTLSTDEKRADTKANLVEHTLEKILSGAPAAPGVVTGPVKIISDIKNIGLVTAGDIMVTDMTTPDFVPAMKRAAGIITNRGGLTSHAAIVSRELGVPCVVGTTDATKKLKTGMIITLNGQTGEVFKGAVKLKTVNLNPEITSFEKHSHSIKTATKVYVNLAEPEIAEKIAERVVDGVGLLRAEFMIAGIGTHPKKLIAEGKQAVFVDKLAAGIEQIAKAFFPRPVVYRATDFKTNEYRHLKGGDAYEVEESNPMLGYRGAFRYVADPAVFMLELEAIKKVRNVHKMTNVNLMIPFVRTPAEMLEVKKIVAAAGLTRSSNFKLWMMVEIPSNVILLDEFIDVGIDGVSIGSNDLTMMIMGTDRDNSEVASVFDERNPAVLWALEKIIQTCKKRGITCGICGQAPSQYPELVEKLVAWGVTSVSINPDAIERTRDIIYHAEHKHITHGTH